MLVFLHLPQRVHNSLVRPASVDTGRWNIEHTPEHFQLKSVDLVLLTSRKFDSSKPYTNLLKRMDSITRSFHLVVVRAFDQNKPSLATAVASPILRITS